MMPGDVGDKVTIAVLGERLKTAIEMIGAQNEQLRALTVEVREMNRCQGEQSNRITALETTQTAHGEEIGKLRQRDNMTGIMAALGAFGAALAGIFVKGP